MRSLKKIGAGIRYIIMILLLILAVTLSYFARIVEVRSFCRLPRDGAEREIAPESRGNSNLVWEAGWLSIPLAAL
jgi:hypothetical protein